MSQKYVVFARWEVYDDITIKADSWEEAIEKAYTQNIRIAGTGTYVDDTFEVSSVMEEDDYLREMERINHD